MRLPPQFKRFPAMRAIHAALPVLLAGSCLMCANPASAQLMIGLNIVIAPPALLVYEQPEIPGEGYIWTPGYWSYGDDGYFWVAGLWVRPPQIGFLWTPGYWGWRNGYYAFNSGYWGPHVGFYGGINYGFGYGGSGYDGGRWEHGAFAYNRNANNFGSRNVEHVYNSTVIINNTTINRVSYNGGTGIATRPSRAELGVAQERHVPATEVQTQHLQTMRANAPARGAAPPSDTGHGQPQAAAPRGPDAGGHAAPQPQRGNSLPAVPQANRPPAPGPAVQPRAQAPEQHAQPPQSRPQAPVQQPLGKPQDQAPQPRPQTQPQQPRPQPQAQPPQQRAQPQPQQPRPQPQAPQTRQQSQPHGAAPAQRPPFQKWEEAH